jgi:hypothetical protein
MSMRARGEMVMTISLLFTTTIRPDTSNHCARDVQLSRARIVMRDKQLRT